MSAQGGSGKKPNAAQQCVRCGNRHEGPCLPPCGTCGKVHKGICRYAQPIPTFESVHPGRQPSWAELTARYNAQQLGHQQGYQQAFHDFRSSLGMGPGMGAPAFGPFGGYNNPYVGAYGGGMGFGGFGGAANPGWGNPGWGNPGWGNPALGNPGWGNQVPGSFGPGYGGFATPSMGQGPVAPFGNIGPPTGNYEENRAPTDSRNPRGNQQSKEKREKKEEKKGPLAAKSTGVEKSISKSAIRKAKMIANQRKKKEEEKRKKKERAASSGPTDRKLLRSPIGEKYKQLASQTQSSEPASSLRAAEGTALGESEMTEAELQALFDNPVANLI